MTTEEIKKTWVSSKFPDKLIKSFEMDFKVMIATDNDENIKTIENTDINVSLKSAKKNVIFSDEWLEWNESLQDDWGIDNDFIIWFKSNEDLTLFKLRWM